MKYLIAKNIIMFKRGEYKYYVLLILISLFSLIISNNNYISEIDLFYKYIGLLKLNSYDVIGILISSLNIIITILISLKYCLIDISHNSEYTLLRIKKEKWITGVFISLIILSFITRFIINSVIYLVLLFLGKEISFITFLTTFLNGFLYYSNICIFVIAFIGILPELIKKNMKSIFALILELLMMIIIVFYTDLTIVYFSILLINICIVIHIFNLQASSNLYRNN